MAGDDSRYTALLDSAKLFCASSGGQHNSFYLSLVVTSSVEHLATVENKARKKASQKIIGNSTSLHVLSHFTLFQMNLIFLSNEPKLRNKDVDKLFEMKRFYLVNIKA